MTEVKKNNDSLSVAKQRFHQDAHAWGNREQEAMKASNQQRGSLFQEMLVVEMKQLAQTDES